MRVQQDALVRALRKIDRAGIIRGQAVEVDCPNGRQLQLAWQGDGNWSAQVVGAPYQFSVRAVGTEDQIAQMAVHLLDLVDALELQPVLRRPLADGSVDGPERDGAEGGGGQVARVSGLSVDLPLILMIGAVWGFAGMANRWGNWSLAGAFGAMGVLIGHTVWRARRG